MGQRGELGKEPATPLARVAWGSVVAVVFLIFVGGMVRASGAGLGCPDWPKCWGLWWPPSDLSEVDLPAVLEKFQERNPDLTEADLVRLFDPVHLWIEYINRLIGVVIGLFVMGTVAVAAGAVRGGKAPRVVLEMAFFSLLLVGFNGWLGGSVVKSHLAPAMVTAHLACAFFLLAVLLYVALVAKDRGMHPWRAISHYAGILAGAVAVQIIIGSQVRGGVDVVMKSGTVPREKWLGEVEILDHAHRAFSWLVLVVVVFLAFRVFRAGVGSGQKWAYGAVVLAIAVQALVGVGLAYGGFPPVLQALHVGVPGLMICAIALFWFVSAREANRVAV